MELLGRPLATSRIVYDPDEPPGIPEVGQCEFIRSIQHQRAVSTDPARGAGAQRQAAENATRLSAIATLHAAGDLVILDMTSDEMETVGRLTSANRCGDFGLRFPLHPGEAACLAIAVTRNLALATDDGDALRALDHHAPGHPYQRIRKLLITAKERNLLTALGANQIHQSMVEVGFWDRENPFPDA